MFCQLRVYFVGLLLVLMSSFAQAATVPISVYPNPADFGTVAQNSSGYLIAYVSNVSLNSVNLTSMTISGANSADFALASSCIGTLPSGQSCQMTMIFTPSVQGSRTANLLIGVQGLSQKVSVLLDGIGGAPIPVLTSMSPATAYVNGAGFALTLTGSAFASGDVAYWNNSPLTTTYVSSAELIAQVPASSLTGTGSDWVTVANPNGNSSGGLDFNVIALDPFVNNISPSSIIAKSPPPAILVNGSNFMTGASVKWNGKTMPTTYLSSTQLQVTPTTDQLASAKIVQLSVTNPAPGGASQSINFNVTYPAKVTVLNLPANDLVWDPYAQRIYASLPSTYGSKGNSIVVINPSTGKTAGYYFAGSEPNQLGLSADSKYLYVGLNGNGSVQRLLLPSFAPDINISLGTTNFGLNSALDLQVSPSDAHSIAVPEGSPECCSSGGLYFYKDANQLPDSIPYPFFTSVVYVDASTLYGYNNGTLGDVAVNSSGGTLGQQWNGLVQGNSIQYDNGLIYGSNGQAFNPVTGKLVGTYDVNGNSCCNSMQVLPDSAIDRVFAVGTTPFFNSFGITSYDLAKFTPVAVTDLSQLTNTSPLSFTRWGSSGLAFVLQNGCCGSTSSQVVLVQSPSMLMTAGGSKNPAPVAQTLSPASATHGTWNFPLTVKGTGFVPGSQATWNGIALTTTYLSATQLTVYVPAGNVAATGTAQVIVTNPAPGGGSSSALSFTIN